MHNLRSLIAWLFSAIAPLAFAVAVVASASFIAVASPHDVGDRRAALVIGNSDYASLPKLPNAANDVAQIGQVLRDANFEVTVGQNLTKQGLEKSIRDFLQTLNDGDVALFYYSGHAVQVAGENFIIPVDANLTSSYDLEVESYNITSLLEYMRASSGLQILVLDSCRDNPFKNEEYYLGSKKVDVKGAKGLASLVPRQGSLIVYSTAPNEVAYDGGGKISPFAGAFAENILAPNTEIREVLTKIRTEVIDKTGGKQVPWDVSSLTSQFYFISQQNLLVLGESLTEVRVSPETTRVELRIEPPIASGAGKDTASFDKVPKSGILLLDDEKIRPNAAFDAARITDVVYATEAGAKPVELIPYTIRSEAGQTASGAVAIVFDPTAAPSEPEKPLVVAEADTASVTKSVTPVTLTLSSDVGTGFAAVPAQVEDMPNTAGWLRLSARDPATQVAVGTTMLVLGDLVKAEDVPELKIRPALHQEGLSEVVLKPASEDPAARPLVIAVDAETNACDTLAAEPLDIQAVTDGVLPNDISIVPALTACKAAVANFPEVARFKYQLGRALYADGKFDEAMKMVRAAIDQGHVRAGQFLGRLYQLGSGVELDPAKAIPLFEEAARKGDPYGQYSLARALMDGKGVKADVERGMRLLTQSMESGHTYALNQLGSEYLNGKRVEKDVERARLMFEKSVERGDVWGEVNLAVMYRDGVSVPKDPVKAYELLEAADAKLHPFAARLMALMDRNAGKGDEKDWVKLFRKSAARGDGWAAFYAGEIVASKPDLAADDGEAIRLFAFAAARDAKKAADQSRARLLDMPEKPIVVELQRYLIRLGADSVQPNGKLSKRDRAAAKEILGKTIPTNTTDLIAALARAEWIAATPRLDML